MAKNKEKSYDFAYNNGNINKLGCIIILLLVKFTKVKYYTTFC